MEQQLEFNELEHKYFLNGVSFIGVSELLELFENEFDQESALEKARLKEQYFGMTDEEILNQWCKKKEDSILKGKQLHKFAEETIKYYESSVSKIEYFDEERHIFNWIQEKHKLGYKFQTEVQTFNTEYRIAGTIDLKAQFKGKLYILDWKSNEEISKNNWGKYLKYPVNKIADSKFNHYMMQQSFYKTIEQLNGEKIKEIWILHVTEDGIKEIKLDYKGSECKKILDLWKESGFDKIRLAELINVNSKSSKQKYIKSKEYDKQCEVENMETKKVELTQQEKIRLGQCFNLAHTEFVTDKEMFNAKTDVINQFLKERTHDLIQLVNEIEEELIDSKKPKPFKLGGSQ